MGIEWEIGLGSRFGFAKAFEGCSRGSKVLKALFSTIGKDFTYHN